MAASDGNPIDVADGEDMGNGRAEALVDGDPAAIVGLEPGEVEAEVVGRTLTAGRVEDGVRGDPLAALERRDRASVVALDGRHDLAEAEHEPLVAKVVPKPFDDLVVAEVEHRRPALDDRDLRAERREHRGVLDPDDAGADDDDRRRDLPQAEQAVRVDHGELVELDLIGPGRARPDGDHDVRRGEPLLGAAVERDAQRVRVDEAGAPETSETWFRCSWSRITSTSRAITRFVRCAEILHRDVRLDPVARAVHLALAAARSGT